jgi:hypothetical protein
MSDNKKLPRRLQSALVTIGCFINGAPMPPVGARSIVAVLTLTQYPLLAKRPNPYQ